MTILDPSTAANPLPAATLMTPEHLAEYLGVTSRWVYNNHQKLGIPAFHIGRTLRFRRSDIDAWLDMRRTG